MSDRVRTFFPDEPGELVFTSPDGQELMRVPWRRTPPPVIKPEQPGVTSSALKRGALNTASSFANFGGLLSEAAGQEDMANSFYSAAEDFSLRAEKYVPAIGRVENIQSVSDAGVFAWEVLLENAPMLASMVIPGGLVGKGVGLLTKSRKAAAAAGTTAAFLSDVGIQTGESTSIAREHGASPVDMRVVGSGLGKAALDFAPLLGLANRIGLTKNVPLASRLDRLIFGELAERGFIRRAGRASAGIVAAEVPTETAQEVMNIALTRAFTEYEGQFTPEEKSQLLNAAAGAAAFGLLGIPAAVGRGPAAPERDETPPDKQPEETKLIGRDTDFELGGGLEGEVLPPDDSDGGGVPPGLPNPTQQLEGPQPEFVYIPQLEHKPEGASDTTGEAVEALQGEPEITSPVFAVGVDGTTTITQPRDPILEAEEGPDEISQGLKLTKEQFEVASRFPEYLKVAPTSPEGQALAGLHPGLQRAFELRAEIEADEENYRTTDGQLKKAAKARLDKINAKILAIQKALGINPENYNTKEATEQNVVEEVEEVVEPAPITERQKQRLILLQEKETVEGLTEREYEEYSELLEIAVGRKSARADTRHQTKEELKEVEEVTKQVLNEDYKRVRPAKAEAKPKGIDKQRAKTVLEDVAAKLKFGPRVRILDAKHPDTVKVSHLLNGNPRGFFLFNKPGEVSIVPENIESEEQLIKTYVHETVAHYGLRTFMTDTEVTDLLMDMLRNPPPNFDMAKLRENIANGQGLSATMEMEEYIAQIAEEATFNPKTGLIEQSWWKRLIALVRRALRRVTRLKWTDNDILALLRDTSKALTGRITPRNYTASRNPDLIREDIGYQSEQLSLIDDLIKGKNVSVIPDELTLIEESEVAVLASDFQRAKARVQEKIKNLREELKFAEKNQYFRPDVAFGAIIGKDTLKTANDSINSVFGAWGLRFQNMFLTPLQYAKQNQMPGTESFLEHVQQWWARKRTLTDDPAKTAQKFMNMGVRNQQKLSQAVLEISIRSDELQRRLTREETEAVFKELGMENDTELKKLWMEMDESFQKVVEQLREGMSIHAIRVDTKRSKQEATSLYKQYLRRGSLTTEQEMELMNRIGPRTWFNLGEIETEMDQLLNRNYFPRSRFGNWAITIRAKKDLMYDGKSFKGPKKGERGEVLYFETFATEREQRKAFEQLAKEFPEASYQMQKSKIAENEFHFLGTMSPELYRKLQIELGDLTEEQRNSLKEIYLTQSPGRSFLRHLTQRKGIAGYSEDVLRVYASYMMNVANHIARVEYHLDMNESLNEMRNYAKGVVPDANKASIVREYFEEHFDYLMNPKNDLAQMRAFGFLWYLGFNVKSALVNLTQVPMIAHSFLASKYGDGRSVGALTNALKVVTALRTGKTVDPVIRKWLNQAIREGFVDESRATELAGLAEQSTLQRILPVTKQGKLLQRTSFYGAYLFQKAERVNREVTFIAAFNLARQNGLGEEQAFKAGREAVQTAMFEYAKWNRAKFMRGKKSVFFLFWQYMQGLSYIAFGGAGSGAAMRTWMMLLLAAGVQGLPFAENILDILDYVGTKAKDRLGMDDPKVDLRADLRQLALELTDRPDLVMHGLSRYYGLGPLHLLGIAGVPVPNVDISGSLSAGRVIPGLEGLTGYERDPAAKLGRTMIDAFGPVAGIGYQFFRLATDSNPDRWKVWERALPVALKNVSSAARRRVSGEESYRGGGAVQEFDWQNIEHRAEIIANAVGFAPTRLNQRYEADFAVESMKQYWAIRRGLVMENMAMARMAGDPEAMKDARDALVRFNSTVPSPALRINPQQLQQSLKQRFRRASLREQGLPSEQLFRQISEAMRDLYPEASVDIGR